MKPLLLRILTVFLMILTGFLLQDQIFSAFHIVDTTPNIMLLLTVCYAFLRGKYEGMLIGALCGFLADIFYGDVIGFYILLYLYMGLFCGLFHEFFYPEQIVVPILLCALCELFYGFVLYAAFFLLNNHLNIGYYMLTIAMPEMVYTVIVTIIFYRFLMFINAKVEAVEKRSAKKFV